MLTDTLQRARRASCVVVVLLLAGMLAACAGAAGSPVPAALPSAAPAAVDDQQALWAELREGHGLVVLLRHARTTPGTGDPPGFQLGDCATQRNLSDEGRAQAAQIGGAFRAQGVPVRSVLSSQYCRCLDTAALLGLGPVAPAPMLNSFFEDRSTADAQTAEVRQSILDHQARSGVIIMVTHMVNIVEVSGVSPQQGEAVVVRGAPEGQIEVVGRLLAVSGGRP